MIINRYYIDIQSTDLINTSTFLEVFEMEDSKKLKEWIFQINRKKNI